MRSIQLVAPRTLEELALPDPPDPGPGELLVRTRAVGLCGSDLHWYSDGHIGRSQAAYPQVLGHEPLCEVVRAGPGITSFSEGQRVTVEPSITCGHCEQCLAGLHNLCVWNRFMGGPKCHGFLREYAVVPVQNATAIPDGLSDALATLIEPMAVMAHLLDLVTIRPGDTVAITGAGPIGMLCAAVAKSAGAAQVFICDRVHHRLELAMRLGATMACDIEVFDQLVRDETRGRGADVALEASGSPQGINSLLRVARPSATVVLIGLTNELNIDLAIHEAMSKELTVKALKRSNHCDARAIRMLENGVVSERLITHFMPLEETPKAFEILSRYEAGVGKIIIELFK